MDEFDAKSQSFQTWLIASGASLSPSITLQDLRSKSAGRGVVAVEDIPPDSVLFSIPRRLVLSTLTSDVVGQLPDAFASLDPWLSLILVMIYEYNRGNTSSWKPYFDILPADFDTLMFWTPEELDELQASAVTAKIGKQQAEANFREHVVPLVLKNWNIFGGGQTSEPSEEKIVMLAHRMGSLIMAYAFDIEDDKPKEVDDEGYVYEEEDEALTKGMVPMADMLNADADRNNARLFYEPAVLVMKSLHEIKKGEEIFNDYGPLPRSDFLRRYGYITPHYEKYDVVELSRDLIVRTFESKHSLSDAEIEKRLTFLDDQGVLEEGFDLSRTGPDAPASLVSDDLLILLATLFLQTEEFNEMERKQKLPKARLTPPIARVLSTAVTARIAEYKTTLQEDTELVANTSLSGRKEMALSVRIGEKQILFDALEMLRNALGDESGPTAEEDGSAKKKRKLT